MLHCHVLFGKLLSVPRPHGRQIDANRSTRSCEADLIFARHKPKGARKIDYDLFLQAPKEIAGFARHVVDRGLTK